MNTNSKEYLDALFEAIKADNADFIVGHLAHADVDVNEIYNFEFTGETLLHYAVKFNAINILKTLLADPRVDRNAFNHIGYTPLHSAAMYWKKECIDILLADKEVDPSITVNGNNALHLALDGDINFNAIKYSDISDFVGTIQRLVNDDRIDPNRLNADENSPLHTLTNNLYILSQTALSAEALRVFLSNPNININLVDKKGNTALQNLSDKPVIHCDEHINIILNDDRLDPTIFVNLHHSSALQLAAKMGNIKALNKFLSNENLDPNERNKFGDTPLSSALKENKIESVRTLLASERIDPNAVDFQGHTPLHLAACYGNDAVVSLLLSHSRVDPTLCSRDGRTPLHMIFFGRYFRPRVGVIPSITVLNLLISDGRVDPNVSDIDDYTPLKYAFKTCSLLAHMDLLNHPRLDPHTAADEQNNTALHYVAISSNISLLENFLSRNIDISDCVNFEGKTPLHWTVEHQNLSAIKMFLENERSENYSAVVDIYGNIPLDIAYENYNLEATTLLLQAKNLNPTRVNKSGNMPIHMAASTGDVILLKKFLANNDIDPNVQNIEGGTPLLCAVEAGKLEVVEILLADNRVNPLLMNVFSDGALHLAAKYCANEILERLLIDGRLDPNAVNLEGRTPLLDASSNANSRGIELLLANNRVDPLVTDKHGNNAIAFAALFYWKREPIELLLKDGRINPNACDKDGFTPLLKAANSQKVGAVEILLADNRVDPLLVNKNGENALHLAARQSFLCLEKLLMDGRLDPNAVNLEGRPPLLEASKYGKPNCIKLLLDNDSVDPTVTDKNGNNAIALAVSFAANSLQKLELLLSDGRIDPNLVNTSGDTPTHIVLKNNYFNLVELLLNSGRIDLSIQNKLGLSVYAFALSEKNEAANIILNRFPFFKLADTLLSTQARIKEFEAKDLLDIDSDENVNHASKHFSEEIEPHFKEKFESFGENERARVVAIERNIRETILTYILNVYKPSAEIIKFIEDNKEELILGPDTEEINAAEGVLADAEKNLKNAEENFEPAEALEKAKEAVRKARESLQKNPFVASIKIFENEVYPAYSAWRAYNPFAPAFGSHPNLLTEHDNDTSPVSITTPASLKLLQEGATNSAASMILRKRVAYYYLVATDETHPENIKQRVSNFFNKLGGDIRDGNGFNNPACFPGTLSLIPELAKDHPAYELQPTIKQQMIAFFKKHILDQFQAALRLTPPKMLFDSLTYLTTESAESYIKNFDGKNSDEQALFEHRNAFTELLAENADTLLSLFQIECQITVGDEYLDYFIQYLLDPAFRHTKELYQAYKEFDDLPASEETIANAASCFKSEPSNAIYTILFKLSLSISKDLSNKQIESLVEYLSIHARMIHSNSSVTIEDLKHIQRYIAENLMGLEGMMLPPLEPYIECFKALEGFHLIEVDNPYKRKASAIETQLKVCHRNVRPRLEQNRDVLKEKSEIYDTFLREDNFKNTEALEEKVEDEFNNRKRKREEASSSEEPAPKRQNPPVIPMAHLKRKSSNDNAQDEEVSSSKDKSDKKAKRNKQ